MEPEEACAKMRRAGSPKQPQANSNSLGSVAHAGPSVKRVWLPIRDYGGYTPAERERVRALMDDFYQDFLAKVAEARGMTVEEVDQIAQGRVWTGEQALANGLVDELGGLDTALEILKKNAGISPDAQIDLVVYPRTKSLIEMVIDRLDQENVRTAFEAWRGQVLPWKQIERIFPSPIWARMPYAVEFE